ncbi:C/D box methylation guide ribonucleoprotein complex aNOP56 subunit [archaeon]|nr:C/D box methylation guide ribonucleoprotein complex aNOP56 subunit [archaeon]
MENVFVVTTALGIVTLNSNLEVEDTFPVENEKDFQKQSFFEALVRNYPNVTFVVEDENLKKIIEQANGKAIIEQPSRGGRWVRENMQKVSELFGVKDYLSKYREFALEITSKRISEDSARLDKELIALVNAYESINGAINELTEKLQDLNDLFFPELRRVLRNPEKYVSFLIEYPSRELLLSAKNGNKRLEVGKEVVRAAEKSIGAPIRKESEETIYEYAKGIKALYKLKDKLTERIAEIAREIAPNLSEIAGPVLAAKLITKAGGLVELAKMPSSTVQVIGAEKALFRAIKEGSKPPKHGMIFQHPLVHNAPRKLRGKVARTLASKIVMAARFDAFSGVDSSQKLKSELKEKLKKIGVKMEV